MLSRGGYAHAFVSAGVVLIAGLALCWASDGLVVASGSEPGAGDADGDRVHAEVRTAVEAARRHDPLPADYRPGLAGIGLQKANVGACDYETSVRRLCRRGDRDSRRTIVVLGDSHARHWIPAIDLGARANGYAAYFLVKPSCNASDMQRTRPSAARTCNAFRAWAVEETRRLHPDVVVIAGQVPPSARAVSGRIVRNDTRLVRMYEGGLIRRIRQLSDVVGDVAVIGDAPGLKVAPKQCLTTVGNDLRDCTFHPIGRDRRELHAARRAATRTGARFVDPRPWFCDDGLCPTIVGGVLTYRDDEHVMPLYAGTLAGVMAGALRLTPGQQ